MKALNQWLCLSFMAVTQVAWALPSEMVREVQNQWAKVMYESRDEEMKEERLEELSEKTRLLVDAHPEDIDLHVWKGIVLSSYAGVKGGLGALGLVKEAKAEFEQVIQTNPQAMSGSAYTSLGSLYYQVPGWPIGFGDDDKAETLLKKGLEINPDGIDSNYFYGDYLYRKGRYIESERVLEHALQAHRREGRALADSGRKREIQQLLEQVRRYKG